MSTPAHHRIRIAKQLWEPRHDATYTPIASTDLCDGDYVLVEAGDVIPADGEVVEGEALVAGTGTGADSPVLCRRGGDHHSVVSGARVVSSWLVIRVIAHSSF
ncbi:MAG TPA: hypothetical protein VGX68_08850 [Thermoanaerobaculia bacterium]|jgi:K+-transporting ATPase ATPase B chain|nr:hypothetical protein [Thermoanaerobaculia bacterium]